MRVSKDNSVEVEFPAGIEFIYKGGLLTVKGPKGETSRKFVDPLLTIKAEDKKIVIGTKRLTKGQKTKMGTIIAHMKNMIKGVTEGIVYKLKICSAHFPMSVQLKGQDFVVNNFIGEKFPRSVKMKYSDTKVEIAGDIVTVTGVCKEHVSQTAATIESLMRRPEYDKRIFQDGIYITDKDGKHEK